MPSRDCTTCGNHKLYDAGSSSSFSAWPGTEVYPAFATGADSIPLSQVEGANCTVNTETVSIGDLQVKNQSFLSCSSYTPALDNQPIDGIIGLGLPNATGFGSWFWNLYDGGQLGSPVFSFSMPAGKIDGAELTLGGIDETKYTGPLTYMNLSKDASGQPSGWTVDLQAIYFGGSDETLSRQPLDGGHSTPGGLGWSVLDTGTAFIQAPDNETAARIYAGMPQITVIDPAGAWGAPCSVLDEIAPSVTFALGTGSQALNLTLPKASFNLGEYPGKPGICQAVFNSPAIPSFSDDPTPVWIIGSPLLKAFYTVWDGINLQVGWGRLAI